MSLLPSFNFTLESRRAGLSLPFGLLAARDVSLSELRRLVEVSKTRALDLLRGVACESIENRISRFSAFFGTNGFACPLPNQIRGIKKKGFPHISPYVDALIVCEMMTGLLMGVQDLNSIEGAVVYDVAQGGESFQSMRDLVTCKTGEIVLRDERSIIASYFQGPNRRINVTATTTSVLFFVFGAPGLEQVAVHGALKQIAEVISPSAKEIELRAFACEV